MQPEIRHADRMGVRVTERDTKAGTTVYGIAFLARELLSIAFYNVSTHKIRNVRGYQKATFRQSKMTGEAPLNPSNIWF
jgi:hypothetical protein